MEEEKNLIEDSKTPVVENKRCCKVVSTIRIAVLTFVLTIAGLFLWSHFHPQYTIMFNRSSVDYANIEKFNTIKNILEARYYKPIDENTLLEGAISGMASSLSDPYTVYFTKEQMKMFSEKTGGSYVGIGVSINLDNQGLLTIVECFEGSPTKTAGLLPGDKIIKVDDKDVTQIKDEDLIIKMIKGTEGTNVKITVYRQSSNQSLDFNILRKAIKVNNIQSEVLSNKIGYIRISTFDSNIADYFDNHLSKLLTQNIKGLIIDVRNNPGGDYEQVVNIADRLLPEGLIVYTEDKNGKRSEENSDGTELNLPMAIVVNENSASASEVLAGAIKDHQKGVLIGVRTFGKGLVQNVQTLKDGSGIKYTVAKYFTPSGAFIQGVGIKPDEVVELDKVYANMPISQIPHDKDAQLLAAEKAVLAQQGK